MSTENDGGVPSKTVEEIAAEFENYKLKTREWQVKVRDRDTRMRDQLRLSTDRIREQDVDIEKLHKRIAELEAESKRLELMNESQRIAETKREAVEAAAHSSLMAQHEAELAEQQEIIARLRQRVEYLEEQLAGSVRQLTGVEPFFATYSVATKQLVPSPAGPPCIHKCCTYDGTTYCLMSTATRKDEECRVFRWIDAGEFHQLWAEWVPEPKKCTLPPTCREDAARLRKELEEQFSKEKAAAVANAEIAAKKEVGFSLRALEERMIGERAAAQRERESVEASCTARCRDLEVAIASAKSDGAKSLQDALRAKEAEHAKSLEAIRQSLTVQTESFEQKCRELDDYKAKAQLVLRQRQKASPEQPQAICATSPRAVQTSLIPQTHQMMQTDAEDDSQMLLEVEKRVALRTVELEKELNFAQQKLSREKIEAQMQLRVAERRKRLVDAASQASGSAVVETPTGSRGDVPEVPSHRTESKQRPSLPSHIGGNSTPSPHGSSEFNFDDLLQTTEASSSIAMRDAALSKRDRVICELKGQLKCAVDEAEALRLEVRDTSAANVRHIQQENLLKETLREEERRHQRSQTVHDQADYIKNIVVQFVCGNQVVRQSLVPVLSTLLQLSNDERKVMERSLA